MKRYDIDRDTAELKEVADRVRRRTLRVMSFLMHANGIIAALSLLNLVYGLFVRDATSWSLLSDAAVSILCSYQAAKLHRYVVDS